jgi:hypothetical protein
MPKDKLCPQCKIRRFQVKNDAGNIVVVTVTDTNEIIPIHKNESLEGFNLDVLYCLGCSWKGTVKSLVLK